MNRPTKKAVIYAHTDNVDFYHGILVKASQNWVTKTGFIIKPNDISFNLHDTNKIVGLSFVSCYIYIDNALDYYGTLGAGGGERIKKIKSNKYYDFIRYAYTFKITRDNAYYVDSSTVSCEYYEPSGQMAGNTEVNELAAEIGRIINLIKNVICESLYLVVKKVDREIKEMEDTIKLTLTEKAHLDHKNAEGNDVYIAKAVDENYPNLLIDYDFKIFNAERKVEYKCKNNHEKYSNNGTKELAETVQALLNEVVGMIADYIFEKLSDIKEQQESDRYLEELFNTCDIWFYSDGTLYNRTVEE